MGFRIAGNPMLGQPLAPTASLRLLRLAPRQWCLGQPIIGLLQAESSLTLLRALLRAGTVRHFMRAIAFEWLLVKVQRSVGSQGNERHSPVAAVIELQNLTGCSQPEAALKNQSSALQEARGHQIAFDLEQLCGLMWLPGFSA
jgi:hypothetical protein